MGIPDCEVLNFSAMLNCKIQKLPLMYLGLPLGANPRKKSTWQPVVDKVRKKFSLEEKDIVFRGSVNVNQVSCVLFTIILYIGLQNALGSG